jgi:hypothetical protein
MIGRTFKSWIMNNFLSNVSHSMNTSIFPKNFPQNKQEQEVVEEEP